MFNIPVLGAMYNLSGERIEYMVLDRLGRLRFLGFRLGETIPDEKMIWPFREKLTKAGDFEKLFGNCEEQLCAKCNEP